MASPLMDDAEPQSQSQYPDYPMPSLNLYSESLYDNAVKKSIEFLKKEMEKSSNEGYLSYNVYKKFVPEVTEYFQSLGITVKRKKLNGCMFGRKYTEFCWDKTTKFNKV